MLIKIDTKNLQKGMYVAQLDRSWLETPFIFQGFVIHEDKEISMLQEHCEYVYVGTERSALTKNMILEACKVTQSVDDSFSESQCCPVGPKPITISRKILRAIGHLDPTGRVLDRLNQPKHYKNVVTTAEEAPRAADAYDAAMGQMESILECLNNDGDITIDSVEQAVSPMIDSVLRNQNAMAWLVYLRKQDEYAYNHAVASGVWAVILGRHLGFDRDSLNTLAMGGILLDVGKTKIPDSIINKAEKLTQQERAIMKTHVKHGVELAKRIPAPSVLPSFRLAPDCA